MELKIQDDEDFLSVGSEGRSLGFLVSPRGNQVYIGVGDCEVIKWKFDKNQWESFKRFVDSKT